MKWLLAYVKGYQAHRAGKHAEAYALDEDALTIAPPRPEEAIPRGHSNLATSLINASGDAFDRGQIANAESLLKELVEVYRRIHQADHTRLPS